MLRSTDGIDELDAIVCMCLYKLLPTLKSEYADILWRADLIGEERGSIAATLNISESNVRTGPDSPCESGLRQLAERVPSMGISIATAPKMEICTPWRKKFKTEL